MEVRLSGGKLVLKILSAHLEPFNADTRVLRLNIRWTNNGNSFVRNYYWTLRLLADDVSHAPNDSLFEEISAHSAKDLEYAFNVPVNAQRVILKITNDEGEEAEVPFDLKQR